MESRTFGSVDQPQRRQRLSMLDSLLDLTPQEFARLRGLLPPDKQRELDALLRVGMGVADITWQPQPGPQRDFVHGAHDADVVIYGGSAGGGKSVAAHLDPLKYCDNPAFNFVIFRRTSPQIRNPGGLWSESLRIYPQTGATAVRGRLEWTFPSGAQGTMRHLQHETDVESWQGAQIPWIGFDELTHFSRYMFFYMLSRNRSSSGVRGKVRGTCNPAPGWVRQFLAPWVDKEYPDPAASGEVRHFVRISDDIVWVDQDFRDEDGDGPMSMTFIRSSVYDNKELLKVDPTYVARLKAQSPILRARLLDGDWDIIDGNFFTNWSEARHVRRPGEDARAPNPTPRWWKYFGGLDYGRLAPFGFLLMGADDAGNIAVIDEIYERGLEPSQQAEKVRTMLEGYGLNPSMSLSTATRRSSRRSHHPRRPRRGRR